MAAQLRYALLITLALAATPFASKAAPLKGVDAFSDWTKDKPGVRRLITPADLPAPHATTSTSNGPRRVAKPAEATLQLPDGFSIEPIARGLREPRQMKKAPNGDIFISESGGLAIRVLPHATADNPNPAVLLFADGLEARPYGLAFYPDDQNPKYLYVGLEHKVIRFPYSNGELKARDMPETIVPKLPEGGHGTRDIAFSADGKTMLIAVGSGSNTAEGGMEAETRRAAILQCTPEGGELGIYASGLRNPVTMAFQPKTGALWTTVNERDGLGDNLPPDFFTYVKPGGFYGYPWSYTGQMPDPDLGAKRPDMVAKAITPDVLFPAHSAPTGLAFYTGDSFPAGYKGDAFVSLHGSWNTSQPHGYKVVRIRMKNGRPVGGYDNFLTGFWDGVSKNPPKAWGRPVGLAVAKDGSLLVADDQGQTIWKVTYTGKK